MTNLQLLLTIGIPSLLVVLAWLSNNNSLAKVERKQEAHDKRFEAMDARFAEIERRFTDIERHFAEAAASTSKRFDDVVASTNKRFDDVIASNHRDALEIMRNMTALHERVAVVESRQAA